MIQFLKDIKFIRIMNMLWSERFLPTSILFLYQKIQADINYNRIQSKNLLKIRKYQLMADEQALLGKISEELFIKLFLPKIQERQKLQIQFLKKIEIFEGLPNNFYLEFSKFLIDVFLCANTKVISK